MNIVHKYNGYEIEKVEAKYSWRSSFYRIKGIDEYFWLLKDAKKYIDRISIK